MDVKVFVKTSTSGTPVRIYFVEDFSVLWREDVVIRTQPNKSSKLNFVRLLSNFKIY